MAATNPISEADLESEFRSDPNTAIEFLDLDYREQIIQYIKRVTWGRLKPDELMDVYQETILGLIQKVARGDFDPARPLRLVYDIAWKKSCDVLRRSSKFRMNTNEDHLLNAVASSLRGTEVGSNWILLTVSERNEFREVVLEAVRELPKYQQIVAQCYLDCFEDVLNEGSFRPLAEAVSKVTGRVETVANVKSAWHVARKKLAAELTRRGITLLKAE